MKNFFSTAVTVLLLFFFLSGTIVAQKESIAMATGTDKGINIDLPAPFSIRVFAGTIHANVDGNATSLYCIDLNHNIAYNQAYQDVSATDIYMSHILNNYYPHINYPYSGSLSTVNKEAAAVQVALWYFSDGLNVNALTDTEIKNRALQIISDANTNAHTVLPTDVLLIIPPSQNVPVNSAVSFVVGAYDEFGNPLAGRTINLTATNGSLSSSSVTTNANGISNSVIFTPNTGVTSAEITAVSNLTIPAGTKYFHVANPNGYQKLILAKPTFASKSVTSTISYYAPQTCDLNGYTTFTYTQGGWGSPNNSVPGTIRRLYFNNVFPSGLTIGYGSNTATFTSSDAIKNYLPAGGAPGTLTGTLINPTTTSAGVLGGQVTALSMNVYFSAFGVLGNNPTPLGNLVIVSGPFAGLTVNQFLNIANQALGGVNTGYSLSAINDAATAINENFNGNNTNNGYLTCAPQVASIGDRVWLDANQDGVQDAGESGLPNVTVKLYNCSDVLVATTTTDANGIYSFTNIPAGSYYVKFELPSGYVFSPANAGSDDEVDSDADRVTGQTACLVFNGGTTNNSIDAGMYLGGANLSITKVADDNQVDCGQNVTYTITVTNNGPLTANAITVSDVLPAGLVYINSTASQGSYDNNTGVWAVGTLANGASATLSIGVQVDCGALNNSSIDLGPASDYNVFVLENINLPSSDTQGKMAAGGNISLSNYSVGNVLTPNSNQDVLVAGGNLYFTSGGIYGGNVAYGGTSNLPTNAVTIFHGTVRHDANVIDFVAAKTYLENLSTTLGGYAANGTVVKEWGSVNMTGNDPFLNVFSVNTADITAAHTVNITVPNGSVVLVNMVGTSIDWKGGLFVNGTAVGNVIYNFPQGMNLRISGIDIRGSILAPFADVNFVAGVQHGQMIAKSITGQGQYNLSPFHGNIPSSNVINIASITGSDQTDPVSGNNSASSTITLSSQSGGGSGSGNWQLVGNLPVGEVVTTLESENNGNILAGTVNGYIYRTTDNGTSWTRINNDMYSGPIWGIEKHANGNILVATVTGVYMSANNGASWQLTDLQYKDVRALKIAANGNVYAGTWGFGIYLSTNNGANWTQINTGLGSSLIITSVTIAPNQDVYAGTFGGGLFKTVNQGANWTAVNTGHEFIWALSRNSNGDIFAGTYGDGLYKSVDNGSTWTKTTFPGGFVYELIVDASDNIFASSYAGGVFVSTDNGLTWTNIGMGGMGLSSMMIVPNSRRIYTGTANGKIYMQIDNTTGINSESTEIPTEFNLSQNYPNPFNPSTKIEVKIAKAGYFKLAVYNMTGQLVASLIDGHLEAGIYRPMFEAGNLPSGIYIYKLVGDNINFSKKMVLIK